jgi:phosphate uptake regulator
MLVSICKGEESMKRKVIQIAGSTQLISLPRKWSLKYGIKKGDELEVEEQQSSIIVSTEKDIDQNKTILDTNKLGTFHQNYIASAYHMGFDEVQVLFNNPKIQEIIREKTLDCVGYEIVDQGKNFCTIKSISHASYEQFDPILRKIFIIIKTMGAHIIEALEKNDHAALKEVLVLEVTTNKLTDFCRRILIKRGYEDPKKTAIMYSLVTDLEKLADDYRDVCIFVLDNKLKISKETTNILKEVNTIFEAFYTAFYKFNKDHLELIQETHQKLQFGIYNNLKKIPKEELVLRSILRSIVKNVYELTSPLVERLL